MSEPSVGAQPVAAPPRHLLVGLSREQLLAALSSMLCARAVDDRLWQLGRQGKAHFVMNPSLKARACPWRDRRICLRDVRLHDGSPAKHTNVLSSDGVGMTSAATRHTAEGGLSGAVRLVRMPTGRTAARRVARIDQHNGNTNALCLVVDKGAELRERPAMQLSALLPFSPHPRANTLEVFKADRPLRAFGSRNNAFADRVVHVLCKAAFLSGKLFQAPSCRLRSARLEFGTQPPMAIAYVVDHAAAVVRSVRIAGDVGHTQVNPKHVVNVLGVGFLNRARHQQILVAAMEQQITLTLARLEQCLLAFATHERDGLPPVERPDRDGRVRQGEREDAVVVGDTGKWAKRAPGLFVELVGVADLGKRPHRHLSRQAKRLAHLLIAQLLKRKLAKGATRPRAGADVVAGSIRNLKRVLQGVGLFRGRLQFQLCCQFHIVKYSTEVRG